MSDSTAQSPDVLLTLEVPFGIAPPSLKPFSVRAGLPIEHALAQASIQLANAAAIAYEVADNASVEFRPLAYSVMHEIDTAKALVEASLAGFPGRA